MNISEITTNLGVWYMNTALQRKSSGIKEKEIEKNKEKKKGFEALKAEWLLGNF